MTQNSDKNKGGRPKGSLNKSSQNIKEIAGRHTIEAVEALVRILRKSKNEQNKLAAAEQILNRAHGKPAQAIVGESDQPVNLIIKWQK